MGSDIDSSPLQLDLVAPGVDLRSTDSLNVIQRVKDSSGRTWYIRQQGALFALYPRGVKPNAAGTDQIPPGTRWFIGIQNLRQALGLPTNTQKTPIDGVEQHPLGFKPEESELWPLGSSADSPSADRWLNDESYRQRAVIRWLQRSSLP